MSDDLRHDELIDLAFAVCDGTATDDQIATVEELIAGDSAARLLYLQCMELHFEMDHQALGSEAADPESPLVFPSLPSLSPLPSPLSSPFVGGPVFSYMVASVVLCMMLLGAWAHKITRVDPSPLIGQNGSGGTIDREFVVVGQVTGMKDCRWIDENEGTMVGAAVHRGRKYAFSSGLMEITYRGGARVILEGPCEYKADSNAGGRLQLGKLVARVEKNDELGIMNDESHVSDSDIHHSSFITHNLFSVTTPTAVVTDLGTEFGVEVGEDGGTYSQVFRGSVTVRLIGDDRSIGMVLHENESAKTKTMSVGETMSLVKSGDADQSRFVRTMPSSSPANSEAYAESVLSLDPVLYYRMELPDGERNQRLVRDSARSGNHGELFLGNEFGGTPYRAGRFGDAISLRGPDARDYVLVKDYPKARENQLTVAAWVMATGRPGWALIAANWGHPTVKGQFHLGLYQRDGDLSVALNQCDGVQVDLREGPDEPLPLFVWQFVAFVADGDALKLYRNGKLVASTACNGVYADPPISGLSVGCRMSDDETDVVAAPPGYHYWQGRIDELAIFTQALSDDQINQLFNGKQIKKEPNSAASRNGDEPMDGP